MIECKNMNTECVLKKKSVINELPTSSFNASKISYNFKLISNNSIWCFCCEYTAVLLCSIFSFIIFCIKLTWTMLLLCESYQISTTYCDSKVETHAMSNEPTHPGIVLWPKFIFMWAKKKRKHKKRSHAASLDA